MPFVLYDVDGKVLKPGDRVSTDFPFFYHGVELRREHRLYE